ncbi:hypothetical protein DFH09DRAFT_1359233, partial [Mycena vulgaris]
MDSPPIPYLEILPFELWQACWVLCSTRHLRRLSLVCQLFRSVCLPLMLQHQSFDVATLAAGIDRDNWIDHLHHIHRTAVRLDRLAAGSLASFVRSWRFSGRAGVKVFAMSVLNIRLFYAMCDRAVATFVGALSIYQNLRSLHLAKLTVDQNVRRTLLALPNLESLTVKDCAVPARDGDLLTLTRFEIISDPYLHSRAPGPHRTPLHIASSETLQHLDLHSLEETDALINGFSPRKLPQLVDLSLQFLPDLDMFLRFLGQCPQLEVLEIHSSDSHWSPRPQRLDPNIIPLMRSLAAPWMLIGLFTLDRPVGAVRVLSSWHTRPTVPLVKPPLRAKSSITETLSKISHASIPLWYLDLSSYHPTLDLLEFIASQFPDLEELRMELDVAPGKRRPRQQARDRDSWGDLDERYPELRDEEAFDNLPPEEISDPEDDSLPFTAPTGPTSSKAPHRDILQWISAGRVSFSPCLEVLRLWVREGRGSLADIPADEQHQAMAALIQMCPQMREVQIGQSGIHEWRRS